MCTDHFWMWQWKKQLKLVNSNQRCCKSKIETWYFESPSRGLRGELVELQKQFVCSMDDFPDAWWKRVDHNVLTACMWNCLLSWCCMACFVVKTEELEPAPAAVPNKPPVVVPRIGRPAVPAGMMNELQRKMQEPKQAATREASYCLSVGLHCRRQHRDL